MLRIKAKINIIRYKRQKLKKMHQIENIYQANPEAMIVNLQYENIRDFALCIGKLQKFPNLRILSLHGNHIRILPLMPQLKILSLDITNNPIVIDNYLLDSLFSLSSLENLQIDATQAEIERILQNLPNLKTINKKKIVREKVNDKKNDLSQRMKDSLKKQKQKIKQLAHAVLQKFQYYQPETLSTFDTNFNEIFEQYRNFSDNVSIDTAKEGVFIYSKSRLLDILQQKLTNSLSENKLEYIADIFEDIAVLRKQYFDSLLRIVLQVGYNDACLEDDLGDEINMEMKNVKLRKQRLYLKQIMRLKKKINDYRTYLFKIEQQNKKYLQSLYSLTRGDSQSIKFEPQKTPPNQKPLDLFQTGIFNREKGQQPAKNTSSRPNLTPSKSSQKLREDQVTPRQKSNPKFNKQNNNNNKVLLSYDQTINLMEEFIAEKHAYNEKTKKKKQAYQTAQQYLSSFFTSKYGVKSIAINWSVNFIRSVQVYARQHSLCEVFLQILKHNIEQSFYEEHIQFIENLRVKMEQMGEEENISQSDAQYMFLHFFPAEDLDQFKIITNINQVTPEILFKELCKTHVKIHKRLLFEFSELFRKYDTNQDGALTFEQAKQFVTQFFRPKIQKAMVTGSVTEKVIKKLDPFKKNKIVFSQLVQIVDKIH